MLHAGVVDEDVERPDLGLDRGDAGVDRRAVGDVEGDVMHVPAQARGRPLQRLLVARVQRDRAARLHQPAREREADPAARAGDERATAADVEAAVRHAAVMSTFAERSASSAVSIASGASPTPKRCETISANGIAPLWRAISASVPS